jgi:LuxR family transcriptional regulator, maltose regulon positive regulatory protein
LRLIGDAKLPAKTVLVIDDYHLAESPEIDRFVELLALNRITDLHVTLIARFSELESREELALKGYLHPVGKETFELTPHEIAEMSVIYFKKPARNSA